MKAKGVRIVEDFKSALRDEAGLSVAPSGISQNVIAVRRATSCLLYVKGRAEPPYRWGVTANVLARLRGQTVPWFVILLFDGPSTGYVIRPADIDYYVSEIWPFGADGDYKPAAGAYLARSKPFTSVTACVEDVQQG